jgi:hypothetical protein
MVTLGDALASTTDLRSGVLLREERLFRIRHAHLIFESIPAATRLSRLSLGSMNYFVGALLVNELSKPCRLSR